ncbi:MAG: sugar phosphate isomerase/epimerase family protein [Pirellulaceae bacterium]
MPELKIGIALSSLRQPLKKALHTAARLGATGVEIDARNELRPRELTDTGRRQLRKMMEDLNLRVAAVRFQTRSGYDVQRDLDRRIDATKEAMQMAYSLGASVVINSVGLVPDETTHPSYGQLAASLTDLARYSHHVGAMLACETGSEPAQRLVGLLDSLPEKAIGINFNPGNLIINEHYDEDSVKVCASHVLSVTARDGVKDLTRGRGVEVPLGRGVAEFPEILGVLEERQYSGWFLIDRLSAADPISEIGYAVSYLRAL